MATLYPVIVKRWIGMSESNFRGVRLPISRWQVRQGEGPESPFGPRDQQHGRRDHQGAAAATTERPLPATATEVTCATAAASASASNIAGEQL